MQTAEIHRRWLDFFAQRGHTVVPSASLVALFSATVGGPLIKLAGFSAAARAAFKAAGGFASRGSSASGTSSSSRSSSSSRGRRSDSH